MTIMYKLNFLKKKRFLQKLNKNHTKLRLSIFKSHKHIYGQIIDDNKQITIAASSTLNKKIRQYRNFFKFSSSKCSFIAGQILGHKAIMLGIKNIVLDRKRFRFHGNIKNFVFGIKSCGIFI